MGSSALPEERASQSPTQAQELHVGAPLSRWLPHLVDGEELKFLDVDEGERMLYAKFEWRDRVVTTMFSIPTDNTSTDVNDARFRSLPSTMVNSVPKIWPEFNLSQLPADGDIIMGFLEGMGSGKEPWVNLGKTQKEQSMYYVKRSGPIVAVIRLAIGTNSKQEQCAKNMEVTFKYDP
jgi:hypothetical protein